MGIVLKKTMKFVSFIKEREDPMFDEFLEVKTDISWSPEDQMYIEDETGQIEVDPESLFRNSINLDLKVHSFVTGSFVVVTGRLENNYKFYIDEITILHDKERPKQNQNHKEQGITKLICAAGLSLTKNSFQMSHYHNLKNFFLFDQSTVLSQVNGLLIFGGIFGQLKDLNIQQYGNFWFQQSYDEEIKDIEKTSIIFERLIEGLCDNP